LAGAVTIFFFFVCAETVRAAKAKAVKSRCLIFMGKIYPAANIRNVNKSYVMIMLGEDEVKPLI
jgi:hypothetical protein